jgi:hypothetical protein
MYAVRITSGTHAWEKVVCDERDGGGARIGGSVAGRGRWGDGASTGSSVRIVFHSDARVPIVF